jgi:hypothetical protein
MRLYVTERDGWDVGAPGAKIEIEIQLANGTVAKSLHLGDLGSWYENFEGSQYRWRCSIPDMALPSEGNYVIIIKYAPINGSLGTAQFRINCMSSL